MNCRNCFGITIFRPVFTQLSMRYFVPGALLLYACVYLIFEGVLKFGMYLNPSLLFAASIGLTIPYFLSQPTFLNDQAAPNIVAGRIIASVLLTLIASGFVCQFFADGFKLYGDYGKYSDVNLQLEALYDRFAKGEQPYYPLESVPWHPFPVYMTAHWIIIAIPRLLGVDFRWVGLVMLLLVNLWFVIQSARSRMPVPQLLVLAVAVPFLLLSFNRQGLADIFVTFETPIAAYYLILAIGLIRNNLWIVATGLILCVLSRYTLVFWFPLFGLILLHERPLKTSLAIWGGLALALLLFYIIPFLLKSPNILLDGVTYHNKAAIDEWSGYGNPPVSYSHLSGVYFAPHMKDFFSGSMEERVWMARAVQGTLMIFLNILGYLGYRKLRGKTDPFQYSLVWLYIIVVCFYAFGPLTYKYYLLTTLVLAVSVLAIIPKKSNVASQT
jgi:hypothetical protein